jgi:26S proteasome regulatory subunit N3
MRSKDIADVYTSNDP